MDDSYGKNKGGHVTPLSPFFLRCKEWPKRSMSFFITLLYACGTGNARAWYGFASALIGDMVLVWGCLWVGQCHCFEKQRHAVFVRCDSDCFPVEFTCKVMVEIGCVQFNLDYILWILCDPLLSWLSLGIHLLFLSTSPFFVGFYVVYTSISIGFCVWVFLSYTEYGTHSVSYLPFCFGLS
jgi:hypothetical protein